MNNDSKRKTTRRYLYPNKSIKQFTIGRNTWSHTSSRASDSLYMTPFTNLLSWSRLDSLTQSKDLNWRFEYCINIRFFGSLVSNLITPTDTIRSKEYLFCTCRFTIGWWFWFSLCFALCFFFSSPSRKSWENKPLYIRLQYDFETKKLNSIKTHNRMSNSRSFKSWLKNNRNYKLLIFNNFVSTSTRHSLIPNLNWIKIVSILKLHMYFPMKNLIYTKREIEIFNEMECKIDKLFILFLFLFYKEFQPLTSASDDSSLSSDQDTNRFFCVGGD